MVSNRMASFPHHLLEGYRTFTSQRLPTEQSRYRELSERGQSPAVMVIGCCDSRVSPEVIFDAGPGELFVVRNVANLVPVYQPDGGAHGVSAALEYAVSRNKPFGRGFEMLEHDPEKWAPGFPIRSCSNNELPNNPISTRSNRIYRVG